MQQNLLSEVEQVASSPGALGDSQPRSQEEILPARTMEGDAVQQAGSTVYFVGAGATRADYPDIPLMEDLLDQILRTESAHEVLLDFLCRLFGSKCLEPAADVHARPRIDDVFTLIDASLSGRAPSPAGKSPEQLMEIRRLMIAAIGRVIAKTIGAGQGRIATRFARALLDRSSCIISTNYDIVMDNALLERRPGNINYGVPIREAVYRSEGLPEGRFDEIHHFKAIPESQATIRTGNISLLKLNGSLNWLYCPRCDELDITLLQGRRALTILDELELGRCSQEGCTSPYQTLLVGPSLAQHYEHRVLSDILVRAERALTKASRLVIIGYSMPDADYLVRAMLARTFAHRSRDVTVVTQVNTMPDRRPVEQRYRRLFADCQFQVDGFAGFVRRLTGES